MSADAHPRPRPAAGGIGRFGYNLALLAGCVMPVSAAALLGVLWMQGQVADLHDGLGGLGLICLIATIPVTAFGIFYLVLVMPLANRNPAWRREIALVVMLICFLGLMALGSAPDADTLAGWAGLGAGMGAWALAINLKPGARATENEWIVAVTTGLLLAVATIIFVWGRQ